MNVSIILFNFISNYSESIQICTNIFRNLFEDMHTAALLHTVALPDSCTLPPCCTLPHTTGKPHTDVSTVTRTGSTYQGDRRR
jgi:hypothetical protein